MGAWRRAGAAVAALVGIAAAACGAPDEEATGHAEAAHTERAHVQENSPYYWASSEYAAFRDAYANASWSQLPESLGDAHPLAIRVQTWLDRIDAIVRADVERDTGKPLVAPRPIAKVLVSRSTFNAWVSGLPVCLGGPFGAPAAPTSYAAYVDRDLVQPITTSSCIRAEGWRRDEAAVFWNAGKPACSLEPQGDGLVAKGRGCTVQSADADDVSFAATSPFIQFTTDLLAAVEEDTVAVVAAHELGHYYRAHVTARARANYGFWYETDGASRRAPLPARNAAELEAAYKEVVQDGRVLGATFGGHYSARLRPLLLSGIAPILAEREEVDFVCARARDALGPWTREILEAEAPGEEARRAYLAFERALAACAPRLELTGDPGARGISAGRVLFAAGALRPGPKAKVTLRFGDTLAAFVDRLDVQAKELDAKAKRLEDRLRRNGVGLYTTEQEADDFAMELSVRLGLSPERVLEAWLDFMRAVDRVYEQSYSPEELARMRAERHEIDTPTCEAMLRAGFTRTDETGATVPVTVPLGALDEAHHGSCYRLFNLWREARAHRYVPGPAQEPLDPPWRDLRAQAQDLAANAAW